MIYRKNYYNQPVILFITLTEWLFAQQRRSLKQEVQPSTLVRFAQTLGFSGGFSGFTEMQILFKDHLVGGIEHIKPD